MNYPKALYKGDFYTDWQKFCQDLALHKVQSCIVTSATDEASKRAEGFVDAGTLMEPPQCALTKTLTLPKKRGMPKGGWPKKCQPSAT